ncbi:MAG: peptide deformylase [Candidatus Marinimicrobia bacterium]|nr:peptide deformylase [Candidatus Neomarinimicrobiota bacterium]
MKPQIATAKPALQILKYGDPILRKKVENVSDFRNIPDLVEQMFNTMHEESGIGLAANQVGYSLNLLILDTSCLEGEEDTKPYILINTEIIGSEGSTIMEEGCLSVPDIRAEIERPESIIIKYQDLEQNFHEEIFTGLVSRVIQHELDHLDGKLFVDYLSPAKQMLIKKRLLEISKNGSPSTGIIL